MTFASHQQVAEFALHDLKQVRQENERLRAALEPFTKFPIERGSEWAERNEPWPDDKILFARDGVPLTVGMVRAARAALST